MMPELRVGMVVPSLNTVAEDDFRRYIPDAIAYHVHRHRLPKTDGVVTVDGLRQAWHEATEAASYLVDLGPDAIAFNCTGASVANGKQADVVLAESMSAELGVPSTNAMVAMKQALKELKAKSIVHICPFQGGSVTIEQDSLRESGFELVRSVGLGFKDARKAALMSPEEIADLAVQNDNDDAGAMLLSCANVRAMEAVEILEDRIGKPVVTTNQAMLWAVLRLAGWQGMIENAGQLLRMKSG